MAACTRSRFTPGLPGRGLAELPSGCLRPGRYAAEATQNIKVSDAGERLFGGGAGRFFVGGINNHLELRAHVKFTELKAIQRRIGGEREQSR